MSQRIEAVVEALDELLARHGRDVVTDPAQMPALLAGQLGNAPRDNPLLRAIVAASHTESLRALSTTADLDESVDALKRAIVTLGLPPDDAADGANAWAEVLRGRRSAGDPTGAATPPVVGTDSNEAVADPETNSDPNSGGDLGHHGFPDDASPDSRSPDSPSPDRAAEIDTPLSEPGFFENEPPPSMPSMPPTPPPVSPDATSVLMLTPPAPPPGVDHIVADSRGVMPPNAPRSPNDSSGAWSTKAKALCAIATLAAMVLGVLAFIGWTRDPSKQEAESAQRQVSVLEDDVAAAKAETKTAQDETNTALATIAERDASLAAANAQIEASSTMTKAQYDNARWPETFTMSGFVAEGSCSLSAAACEKSAVVHDIVISCGGTPCGCADGGCTVTSELWKTPAPVTYDSATGLFTATGMLDGDQFTCGGVPQATAFAFRFRASEITYDDGWVGSEFAAELAESSEATDACLAGGRTYALSGPVAS